jgi:hypothetical protein
MDYDPRIERVAHKLCYVLGENRNAPMTDKDRHDIFTSIRYVASEWKGKYDAIHEENPWFLHNELKIWIRENKYATRDDILRIMIHQEMEGLEADLRKIRVK